MDAILRCEGEPEACADPLRNTSLARAAEAARAGGASDAMILDAIALARAGHADWPCDLEDATSGLAIAFGDPAALALASWATGAVLAARDRAHAEAIAEAAALPRAGVDLAAFWGDAGYDLADCRRASRSRRARSPPSTTARRSWRWPVSATG
jgi:ribonucleoside-diphosphate reductase alpha chain